MLRSTVLFILFVFSAAVYAEDFNYNSVTLSYGQSELDDAIFDVDGDSIGINASFEINDSFHLFAGYGVGELDSNVGVSVDTDTLNAGIGYHMSLTESVDLVTSLSYEYVELSAQGISVDDNGIGLGLGLRYAASESVELNAGISYVDFGDGGDDTSFGAGFLYNFTDTFSVGLSGDWSDDVSSYGLGGRFYFGE